MNLKQILEAAAVRLEQNESNYCCLAIKHVCGMYSPNMEDHNATSYYHAMALFRATQKPADVEDEEGPWWPAPWESRHYGVDYRQTRIDALRRAAALATNFETQ
jgi:hypothetical protein